MLLILYYILIKMALELWLLSATKIKKITIWVRVCECLIAFHSNKASAQWLIKYIWALNVALITTLISRGNDAETFSDMCICENTKNLFPRQLIFSEKEAAGGWALIRLSLDQSLMVSRDGQTFVKRGQRVGSEDCCQSSREAEMNSSADPPP